MADSQPHSQDTSQTVRSTYTVSHTIEVQNPTTGPRNMLGDPQAQPRTPKTSRVQPLEDRSPTSSLSSALTEIDDELPHDVENPPPVAQLTTTSTHIVDPAALRDSYTVSDEADLATLREESSSLTPLGKAAFYLRNQDCCLSLERIFGSEIPLSIRVVRILQEWHTAYPQQMPPCGALSYGHRRKGNWKSSTVFDQDGNELETSTFKVKSRPVVSGSAILVYYVSVLRAENGPDELFVVVRRGNSAARYGRHYEEGSRFFVAWLGLENGFETDACAVNVWRNDSKKAVFKPDFFVDAPKAVRSARLPKVSSEAPQQATKRSTARTTPQSKIAKGCKGCLKLNTSSGLIEVDDDPFDDRKTTTSGSARIQTRPADPMAPNFINLQIDSTEGESVAGKMTDLNAVSYDTGNGMFRFKQIWGSQRPFPTRIRSILEQWHEVYPVDRPPCSMANPDSRALDRWRRSKVFDQDGSDLEVSIFNVSLRAKARRVRYAVLILHTESGPDELIYRHGNVSSCRLGSGRVLQRTFLVAWLGVKDQFEAEVCAVRCSNTNGEAIVFSPCFFDGANAPHLSKWIPHSPRYPGPAQTLAKGKSTSHSTVRNESEKSSKGFPLSGPLSASTWMDMETLSGDEVSPSPLPRISTDCHDTLSPRVDSSCSKLTRPKQRLESPKSTAQSQTVAEVCRRSDGSWTFEHIFGPAWTFPDCLSAILQEWHRAHPSTAPPCEVARDHVRASRASPFRIFDTDGVILNVSSFRLTLSYTSADLKPVSYCVMILHRGIRSFQLVTCTGDVFYGADFLRIFLTAWHGIEDQFQTNSCAIQVFRKKSDGKEIVFSPTMLARAETETRLCDASSPSKGFNHQATQKEEIGETLPLFKRPAVTAEELADPSCDSSNDWPGPSAKRPRIESDLNDNVPNADSPDLASDSSGSIPKSLARRRRMKIDLSDDPASAQDFHQPLAPNLGVRFKLVSGDSERRRVFSVAGCSVKLIFQKAREFYKEMNLTGEIALQCRVPGMEGERYIGEGCQDEFDIFCEDIQKLSMDNNGVHEIEVKLAGFEMDTGVAEESNTEPSVNTTAPAANVPADDVQLTTPSDVKQDVSGLELAVFDAQPPASIISTVASDDGSSLLEMKRLLFAE